MLLGPKLNIDLVHFSSINANCLHIPKAAVIYDVGVLSSSDRFCCQPKNAQAMKYGFFDCLAVSYKVARDLPKPSAIKVSIRFGL
jgi:hypothetical protein